MSAHVLLNLLKELGKSENMIGLQSSGEDVVLRKYLWTTYAIRTITIAHSSLPLR